MNDLQTHSNDRQQSDRQAKLDEIMELYALNIRATWIRMKREHISFWMICFYLFFEYVRPQSIIPALDILPWAQTFILLAFFSWVSWPKRTTSRDAVSLWVLLFFSCVAASAAWATYPKVAHTKLPDAISWVVIYLLIVNIVKTRTQFIIFMLVFFLASFKLSASLSHTWAMRGFSFASWGLKGPPGFFENSGELAIQMAVFWPLALAALNTFRPSLAPWKLFVVRLMPITAIMVIIGASSRGGQIALAVQLIAAYWRRIFRIKFMLSASVTLMLLWTLMPEEQKLRFTEIGEDRTSQQRILYWERGIEMLQSHPGLGVGLQNFPMYFEKHWPDDVLFERAELPHNIFVQVGSEVGYLGLITYIALITMIFLKGESIRRRGIVHRDLDGGFAAHFGKALNIALIGYIVAGQFVSVVYYPFLWIHAAIAVSLAQTLPPSMTAHRQSQ